MVILTDDETNRDLRADGSIRTPSSERSGWEINRIVDYRIEFDVSFELIL
jgi:hypothetical protein